MAMASGTVVASADMVSRVHPECSTEIGIALGGEGVAVLDLYLNKDRRVGDHPLLLCLAPEFTLAFLVARNVQQHCQQTFTAFLISDMGNSGIPTGTPAQSATESNRRTHHASQLPFKLIGIIFGVKYPIVLL
jgi:hypothetical protein